MPAHSSRIFSRRAAVRRVLSSIGALSVAVTLFSFGSVASPSSAAATTALTPQVAAQYAKNMLHLLNRERAVHGERALTMNSKLIRSAHGHNLRMSHDDTMSHQLPGEAFFADR